MYFHVYFFKLQIHAHIYRSFIRHHKMLGVRIAKRKTSLKSRAKANPCGTKLRARIFFGAGKFASQTYPAGGGLKSRGNRRCAASGGRSEPVSRKRRCLWFSKGHKQQCRDGVHPTKVPLANIPFLAGSRRLYILFRTHKAIEIGRPIGCPVSFWSGLSFCSVADCLWRKRKVAALK